MALLADPAAIDERPWLSRADVGRQVAEAQDLVARTRTEAGRARATERGTALVAAAKDTTDTAERGPQQAQTGRGTALAQLAQAVAAIYNPTGHLPAASTTVDTRRSARAHEQTPAPPGNMTYETS